MVSSRRDLCERRLGAGPESVIAITCTTGGSRPATASSAGSTANSARHRGSAAGSGWSSPSARSGVIAASAAVWPGRDHRGWLGGAGGARDAAPWNYHALRAPSGGCSSSPTAPRGRPPHVIPAVIGPDPVRVWEHGLTTKEDSGAIGRPHRSVGPPRSMVVGDQEEFGDGQSHVLCAPYLPRSPWTDRAMSCLMNHGLVLSRSHPTTFRPAASRLVLGSVAALDLRAEGPSALLAQASAAHHGPGSSDGFGSGRWMGSGWHGAEVAHDPATAHRGRAAASQSSSWRRRCDSVGRCRTRSWEVVAWRLVEVRGLPPMLLLRAERRVATAPALAGQIEEQPLTGVGS